MIVIVCYFIYSQFSHGCSYNSGGLFVDWIELLDPEIVSSSPEIQEKFLFTHSQKGKLIKKISNRYKLYI